MIIEKEILKKSEQPVPEKSVADKWSKGIQVYFDGGCIKVFSNQVLTDVSLFDQSGRCLKIGKMIDHHTFLIKVNFELFRFIALLIKVNFIDRSILKRIDY